VSMAWLTINRDITQSPVEGERWRKIVQRMVAWFLKLPSKLPVFRQGGPSILPTDA